MQGLGFSAWSAGLTGFGWLQGALWTLEPGSGGARGIPQTLAPLGDREVTHTEREPPPPCRDFEGKKKIISWTRTTVCTKGKRVIAKRSWSRLPRSLCGRYPQPGYAWRWLTLSLALQCPFPQRWTWGLDQTPVRAQWRLSAKAAITWVLRPAAGVLGS